MTGNILLCIIFLAIFATGTEVDLKDLKENFDEIKISVRESGKDGSGRIVGGHEATKNGYPSVATMYYNGDFRCAGTIVHEEWIVSGASCIQDLKDSPSQYKFSAGDHNVEKNQNTEQTVTASEIHMHVNFNSRYRNDIVLFKVTPPLVLNEFVKKVTLPNPELEPTGLTTVVGWGKLKGHNYYPNLQEVDIPLVKNEKCAEIYDHSIFPESICAGNDKGGKDSCVGDAGSPLYLKEGDEQILVGIASVALERVVLGQAFQEFSQGLVSSLNGWKKRRLWI